MTAPRGQPTADDTVDPEAGRRGLWVRRAFVALLAVIVIAALFGFLGVRSRTVAGQSPSRSMQLSVDYAQIARAGLAVPFTITVTRRSGFSGDLAVSVSATYLDLFDRNAIDPEPAGGRANQHATTWRFDRPEGRTFVMTIDMQVQSEKHFGREGFVTVRDQGDGSVAHATFKTWLAP